MTKKAWIIQDNKTSRYGFAGHGQIITPCLYKNYYPFYNGFATVYWRNKWGLINPNGNLVIPDIYDSLGYTISEGLIRAEKDEKWGYLDTNGRIVIPFKFKSGESFKRGKATVVTLDGCTRIIDRTGRFIDDLSKCKVPKALQSECINPQLARSIADKRIKTKKIERPNLLT